jgi:hypothetical protein
LPQKTSFLLAGTQDQLRLSILLLLVAAVRRGIVLVAAAGVDF